MRQGAEGQCTDTTLRKDMGREMGGVFRIRDTYTSMGRHPWCILRDHRTCHLRNLYADQEAAVTTEHGLTDWFQIGKGVGQGCMLSPCLLICRVHHEEHWAEESTSWNEDCQKKTSITSDCRWHYPLTESEEELKSLLIKEKVESEKVGLKLSIQKTKIMASGPITSWEIGGETVTDFIFLGSRITADGDCSHEIRRYLLLKHLTP